jgi:hypothetical protein
MYTNWKNDSKKALKRLKKPSKRFGKELKTLNPFKMLLPLTWLLAYLTFASVWIAALSLRKLFSWLLNLYQRP